MANDVTTLSEYNDRDQLLWSGADDDHDDVLVELERDSTYSYDANGSTIVETTNGNAKRYIWGLRNRMVGFNANGNVDANGDDILTNVGDATFAYDSDGNRINKSVVGTGTTVFLQDTHNPTGYSQVLEEKPSGSATPTRSYLIGNSIIAQSDGATVRTMLYDGGGSMRALLDATGQPIAGEIAAYDAFGGEITGNAILTPIQYRGQYFDGLLKQYQLRARYYDPSNGRFTSFDSFEGASSDPVHLHKYLYASGNPILYMDPSGHFSLSGTLGTLGLAGVVLTFLALPNIANAPGPFDPTYGDRNGDLVFGVIADVSFVGFVYWGGKLISYGSPWIRNNVSRWITSRGEAAAAARFSGQAQRWNGLQPAERSVAEFIEERGRYVEKNLLEGVEGAGRQGDVFVDGLKSEIKTLSPGGSQDALMKRALQQIGGARRGEGQAVHIIIDARGTELTEETASRIVARWLGKSNNTESVEVIGDGFFMSPFEPAGPGGIPLNFH